MTSYPRFAGKSRFTVSSNRQQNAGEWEAMVSAIWIMVYTIGEIVTDYALFGASYPEKHNSKAWFYDRPG